MPRSSRASLTDETIHELENQFYDFISSLTPEERKKFFSEFLTNEEKMMMYKRLALYWCLLEGYTLSKIQQMIGVTHDTTRVYNKKKNALSDEFKALLKRIGGETMTQAEEKMEEAKEEIKKETMDTTSEPVEEKMEEMAQPDEPKEEMKETHEEKMEEAPQAIIEHHEEEIIVKLEEEEKPVEEKMEEMAQPDEPKEEMKETHEEKMEEASSGLTPSSNSEKEEENENEDGKKKSGLAKFFGF